MSIEQLIQQITQDTVALFFFFMILPVITFLTISASTQKGNQPPFSYIFSSLIYLVAIPGVLSITFWGYAILYGQRSLIELPFTVFYMPLITMGLSLFLINRHTNIKKLPWFGELYELMILIAVASGLVLLLLYSDVLPLRQLWQVLLAFTVLFILVKVVWEQLTKRIR